MSGSPKKTAGGGNRSLSPKKGAPPSGAGGLTVPGADGAGSRRVSIQRSRDPSLMGAAKIDGKNSSRERSSRGAAPRSRNGSRQRNRSAASTTSSNNSNNNNRPQQTSRTGYAHYPMGKSFLFAIFSATEANAWRNFGLEDTFYRVKGRFWLSSDKFVRFLFENFKILSWVAKIS